MVVPGGFSVTRLCSIRRLLSTIREGLPIDRERHIMAMASLMRSPDHADVKHKVNKSTVTLT
jgi:hypothetical protein